MAKAYVLGLARRPFTVYDADWKLVCMLCIELPTIENGLARPETTPDGKPGIAVTYGIRPEARWGDGTPITTRDVTFTWEVGRHPKSGVMPKEFYRSLYRIDAADDRTFTLHFDKRHFDYNAIDSLELLPAHIEGEAFADPEAYRFRTRYADRDDQQRPVQRALRHLRGGRRIARRADAQSAVVGQAAGVFPHCRARHRQYRRARGEPAVRRDRHDRRRDRPERRSGGGAGGAARRPLPGHLQAGAGLRARRRQSRQPDARRPAGPPGAPLCARPSGHRRPDLRRPAAGRRHQRKPARPDVRRRCPALRLRPRSGDQAARRGRLGQARGRRPRERRRNARCSSRS